MPVKKIPQVWETSDGEEWETEKEANARQKLLDAKANFDAAERAYGQVLAETQKTADGYPFEWGVFSDYWRPTAWADGRPSIARISVVGRETSLSNGEVSIVPYTENGQRLTCKVSELFRRESNAKKDLVKRMEQYLAYVKEDLEAMRKEAERVS